MIAAQLLAYYFTELKDDQVKKVSAFFSLVLTQAGWTTVKKRRKPGIGGKVLIEVTEFLDMTLPKDNWITKL